MPNVYERVMQYNQNRDPKFLAIKYKLMSSGAFRFFRGSCHLFYEDLATKQAWTDANKAWICGDMHVGIELALLLAHGKPLAGNARHPDPSSTDQYLYACRVYPGHLPV